MGDEVRATGGLDSAHDRRPPRRSPWGRRPPHGSGYRDGPPGGGGATYAALDLGTNNCRLLVARPTGDSFRVIDAFSRIIRLGEGISASGRISDAAIARAVEALGICRDKMKNRGVTRARLIATEACRTAVNGGEFQARIVEEVGLDLEIIDRETEAELAATGCTPLLDPDAEGVILFDIGGGSSELVRLGRSAPCRRGPPPPEIKAWASMPVGVVTLAERHGGHEVTREVYEAMVTEVAGHLAPFVAANDFPAVDRMHLLGTSGTVTTIAGVHLELRRYDRRRVDGCWMTNDQATAVIERLIDMSYEERVANPCIGSERADLVLAGCAILEAIRREFPCRRAARRRPRAARGHAGADDARRRRVGPLFWGACVRRERSARAMTTSGGGRELKTRVKTGKNRTLSSKLWLERQLNDPYVARAKRDGFRSRAAYKLIEIDDQAAPVQAGHARRRPWRRAGRLEPDRRQARRRGGGQGTGGGDRPARDAGDPRRRVRAARLSRQRRAREAQGHARRAGRRRALRHGGERDRPSQDRPSAHHGACRNRRRFRRRGAGARRRVPLQGAAGRHRDARCWPGSSATSPA